MGVPTSDISYTPAMPRREDHEVHKDMWWQWIYIYISIATTCPLYIYKTWKYVLPNVQLFTCIYFNGLTTEHMMIHVQQYLVERKEYHVERKEYGSHASITGLQIAVCSFVEELL